MNAITLVSKKPGAVHPRTGILEGPGFATISVSQRVRSLLREGRSAWEVIEPGFKSGAQAPSTKCTGSSAEEGGPPSPAAPPAALPARVTGVPMLCVALLPRLILGCPVGFWRFFNQG